MNLMQKLVEIRKKIPYLQKTAAGFKAKYVPGSAVLAAVRAEADVQGVLFVPTIQQFTMQAITEKVTGRNGEVTEKQVYHVQFMLVYRIIDAAEPTSVLEISWPAAATDAHPSPAIGKAVTYAERYCFMKMLNVPTDEMDPETFMGPDEEEPKGNATPVKHTETYPDPGRPQFPDISQPGYENLVLNEFFLPVGLRGSGKMYTGAGLAQDTSTKWTSKQGKEFANLRQLLHVWASDGGTFNGNSLPPWTVYARALLSKYPSKTIREPGQDDEVSTQLCTSTQPVAAVAT